MDTIIEKIQSAKQDKQKLDALIHEYLPFIKKQLQNMDRIGLEFDDMLSLAMITFANCVKQFEPEKGNFLSFASKSIKNRIIDEVRKMTSYASRVVPLFQEDKELQGQTQGEKISLQLYSREQERLTIAEEICTLSAELELYEIKFSILVDICPKQQRSRKLCFQIAEEVIKSAKWREAFQQSHRLPQKELSELLHISLKTIEKHRRYIVTILVILSGDYPIISGFLCSGGGR